MSKKAAPAETQEDQAKRMATDDKIFKQKVLAIPLVFLPLAFSTYFATTKGSPSWWHLHPLAMMFGYVTLAGNSIMMKKVGGLLRTQIHGYLMFAMSACSVFGAYVMWSNKEAAGKPHYTTTHSYIGGTALMLTAFYPVFAWILYNPTTGIKRTDKLFRTIHKWSGRFGVAVAFAAIASGIYSVEKDPLKQGGMSGLWNFLFSCFFSFSFR